MPLVKPKEKESEYVSRCVNSPEMKKEFPNIKQRVAVCHSKYKESKSGLWNTIMGIFFRK